MLKARFSLDVATLERMIVEHNKHGDEPDTFIVEPVKYNDKHTNVVGKTQPIMFLIGRCAAGGFDSLLDVSAL